MSGPGVITARGSGSGNPACKTSIEEVLSMSFGLVNLHMKSRLPGEFFTISGDQLASRLARPRCQNIKNAENTKK